MDEVELDPRFADSRPVTPEECNHVVFERTGTFPSGIRASLGIASNFRDCYRFLNFLEDFLDVPAQDVAGSLYQK